MKSFPVTITPRLATRGKIKIGEKGVKKTSQYGKEFQAPVKLDYFKVTRLDRDSNDNFVRDEDIHAIYGDAPTRIKITLLYNTAEDNFTGHFARYAGKKLVCFGDGEVAVETSANGEKRQIPCNCARCHPEYTGPDVCKLNARLSCMLPESKSVGGVYDFRTTGYNSVTAIMSSLKLLETLTGGHLAGIPLELVVSKKTGTNPKDGKPVTFSVVSVEYPDSIENLRKKVLHLVNNENIFTSHLVALNQGKTLELELLEEAGDIVPEFYPEQMQVDNDTGEVHGYSEPLEEPEMEEPETEQHDNGFEPVTEPTAEPKPVEQQISRAQLRAELENAGFVYETMLKGRNISELLEWHKKGLTPADVGFVTEEEQSEELSEEPSSEDPDSIFDMLR